jgi:hypothetical protein
MAFDGSGNLFVGNTTSASITKITPGGVESTFTSMAQSAIDDPLALAFNSAGNLFVADYGDGDVLEYTPNGVMSFFAAHLGDSGPASLAFNSAGDLFVTANLPNNAYLEGDIYEFTPGGKQSVFASGLYNPKGLAVNSAGDVFVIAQANQDGLGGDDTIYEFTPAKTESTFATAGSQLTTLAFQPVPEPSALGFVGFGVTAVMAYSRRARGVKGRAGVVSLIRMPTGQHAA